MQSTHDPTASYLETLLTGDRYRLLGDFAAEPSIDDPLGGRVRDVRAFDPFFAGRQAWLVERQARIEPLRTTHKDQRAVFECLLHLKMPQGEIALPVAIVGEHTAHNRLNTIRVYHSLWPLFGEHRVRAPLLPRDPALTITDVIAEYQKALHDGDIPAIVGAFEPDGYFREPAGGEYIYRGQKQLQAFMAHLLASGGIHLEHCTATDDGVACCIEFNAIHFGQNPIQPQAGVAVYERGPSGRLHAARIYDDVNVEALAGA